MDIAQSAMYNQADQRIRNEAFGGSQNFTSRGLPMGLNCVSELHLKRQVWFPTCGSGPLKGVAKCFPGSPQLSVCVSNASSNDNSEPVCLAVTLTSIIVFGFTWRRAFRLHNNFKFSYLNFRNMELLVTF